MSTGSRKTAEPGAGLRVEDLTDGLLADISLEVAGGECVCLSGASGAGKTLLLRAIADLQPHRGRVLLDGRACRDYSGPEWRRQVGLLASESAWWDERVGAHFPVPEQAPLAALGLGPEVMDWRVSRLSSGERQRLALARLLNHTPSALLLDEPTANLDPANTERVEALIGRYRRERSAPVLWVSHDPEQARRVAERTLEIEAGRLRGPHAA